MGYSISWLAFSGKSRDEVLDTLHLQDSGVVEDFAESPISAATLGNGWTVVFLNKFDHPFAEDASLALFSKGCKLIAVHVEEHVMFSSASLYEDGRMIWSVFHESERGMYDLRKEGVPPPNFTTIRDAQIELQRGDGGEEAEVDYIFEVPLELAASLGGFKHDRDDPPFSVLREQKEKR